MTRNYRRETGSMTGILEELKWEKRRKDNRLILPDKGLKCKARNLTADLIQKKKKALQKSTKWPFRFPLPVKTPIRKASFLKLAGTGMSSLILSSPLRNCRTTAYLNSRSAVQVIYVRSY